MLAWCRVETHRIFQVGLSSIVELVLDLLLCLSQDPRNFPVRSEVHECASRKSERQQ